MATTGSSGSPERGSTLARGVVAIVVTGTSLGLAQNALLGRGTPRGGLPWIAVETELDTLESQLGTTGPEHADGNPGGAHPLPPDMNDPMAIAGTVAAGSDLPEIPDLGRPLDMNLARVKQFWDAHAAVLVDARTREEYLQGHIPGSVHMDYEQVVTDPAKLEAFDAGGKPIVVYCGGGTCEVSKNLGYALVAAGKSKVLIFTGGWPEWEASGYPVARGDAP